MLLRLLQSQRSELKTNRSLSAQIVGLTDADLQPQDDAWVIEAAAWTVVARVVMNLDEFITRE